VDVKRLALLHELLPKAVRIAVLVNPANIPATESTLRDIPDAARAIGLQTPVLNASTTNEIEAAFATLVRDRADAMYSPRPADCQNRRMKLSSSRGALQTDMVAVPLGCDERHNSRSKNVIVF
jgi:ABC-type uncharacterized transport system substrate-binding protein